MPEISLYVSPYACPRVPTVALEEIGIPFETVVVGIDAGEHKTDAFRALNPKGKVPCLVVDGEPLTENVAILTWLHDAYPDAGLFPPTANNLERCRQIADLSFCAGGLHPIVTRIRMSHRFVQDASVVGQVRAAGIEAMRPSAYMTDKHFAENTWWYGDDWSIIDAYLHWIWFRMTGSGFPADQHPHWAAHYERVTQRGSVQRMLEREADWQATLAARGAAFPAHPDVGAEPS